MSALSQHCRWLEVRGLRTTTVYNRTLALQRLQRWAGGADLLTLTEAQLREWQEQRSRDLTPGARRGELSHAREFYRWAVSEELLPADPTRRLPLPRAPRRMPRPMSESAFSSALAAGDDRVRAVLGLAGYAGLRAMEIAQLDWSELDLTASPATVRVVNGKGGVGRQVFVAPALADLLRALPDRRGPVIRRGDGNRGHNATWAISHLANDHLHSHGVPETLHQLRHRFATVAYRAEADIRAVQELLGHASPQTTATYAAPGADARLRAVLAAGKSAA